MDRDAERNQQGLTPQEVERVERPQVTNPSPGNGTTGGSNANGAGKDKGKDGIDWNAPWVLGLGLIVIGLVFLFRGSDLLWFDNWWAIFIAIPGLIALGTAWNRYKRNGEKIDQQVLSLAAGAFFPLFVAAVFIFELNWGAVWPVFLIGAGIAALSAGSSSSKS